MKGKGKKKLFSDEKMAIKSEGQNNLDNKALPKLNQRKMPL